MNQVVGAALVLAVLVAPAQVPNPTQGPASVPPQTQTPAPAGEVPPETPPALPPQTPAPAPGAQTPAAPAAPGAATTPLRVPGTVACPAPVPPATPPARGFITETGMLLHQVQPARVMDFESFIAYVRDALTKTTNATVRNQARGWKFYRVAEPGPNGDVLYAFVFDPAVPCVDYALGPILAEVYPDPAQLSEIWKLYTASVRSGGTLLNLIAIPAAPPPPILSPPTTTPAAPAAPTPSTQKPAPGQKPSTPKPSGR